MILVQAMRAFAAVILTLALPFSAAQGEPVAPVDTGVPGVLTIGVLLPENLNDGSLAASVARAAAQGATMVFEEFEFNAMIIGLELRVPTRFVAGVEAALAAATELVEEEGAYALVAGFGGLQASAALAEWAAARGIPLLNVGEPSDRLRGELCQPTTFHVVPSAAMYIDALAGWYVRSSFRNWHLVIADDDEGSALEARVDWSLANRHFGGRVVARTRLAPGANLDSLAAAVRRSNADLVVMLVRGDEQLRVLAALEAANANVQVAGFPHPETQTRDFFLASRAQAPRLGSNFRALAFEATLDAYGAREINARYRLRWEEPMDPGAWAVYVGVKMLYEAVIFGGAAEPERVIAYLSEPTSVFDLWKGIGVTFRSWDRQLRQSLYLVKIDETDPNPFSMGLLVGELPAIYMPGTDPVERLDQLGDLLDRNRCVQ
jgi:ABC transporter substrate binding protein (PQQ-dependent alcohol dehydrogenase system)